MNTEHIRMLAVQFILNTLLTNAYAKDRIISDIIFFHAIWKLILTLRKRGGQIWIY